MVKNPAELTLEEWSNEFFGANPGSWDDLDSAQAWLRFVEIAASIAEGVRTEEYAETVIELGKAFGWLCSFVKVYSRKHPKESFSLFLDDLSEMVWRKYPGTCYRCTHELDYNKIIGTDYLACVCLAVPKVPEDKIQLREFHLKEARKKPRPSTLDDWANMIKKIYGPNHYQLSLPAIALHFLEEVGEVAKALRELHELCAKPDAKLMGERIMKLQDEIADVFSWILGLLNKLDQAFAKSREYYDPSGELGLRAVKASTVAADALNRWGSEVVP